MNEQQIQQVLSELSNKYYPQGNLEFDYGGMFDHNNQYATVHQPGDEVYVNIGLNEVVGEKRMCLSDSQFFTEIPSLEITPELIEKMVVKDIVTPFKSYCK